MSCPFMKEEDVLIHNRKLRTLIDTDRELLISNDYIDRFYVMSLLDYPFTSSQDAQDSFSEYIRPERMEKFIKSLAFVDDSEIPLESPFTMRATKVMKDVVEKAEDCQMAAFQDFESDSSSGEDSDDRVFDGDLIISDQDLWIKNKKILENATFTVVRKRIYGLVGKNGIGKSTLLRAIRKRRFGVSKGLHMYLVKQEDKSSLQRVLDYVLDGCFDDSEQIMQAKRILREVGFDSDINYEINALMETTNPKSLDSDSGIFPSVGNTNHTKNQDNVSTDPDKSGSAGIHHSCLVSNTDHTKNQDNVSTDPDKSGSTGIHHSSLVSNGKHTKNQDNVSTDPDKSGSTGFHHSSLVSNGKHTKNQDNVSTDPNNSDINFGSFDKANSMKPLVSLKDSSSDQQNKKVATTIKDKSDQRHIEKIISASKIKVNESLSNLSGGWRVRASLAKAILKAPQLLLLDEPTNMLDFPTIVWLEKAVKKLNTTVVIVSHDREFLNNVCTDILHLDNLKITSYKGNYDSFVHHRAIALENQQKEYVKQQEYRKHLQDFIDRFRYNSKRASLAQSKIKILENMVLIEPVKKEIQIKFRFKSSPAKGILIELKSASVGYTNELNIKKQILNNIDFKLTHSSRIVIVGPNGAGKSTLLRLLSKKLEVFSGTAIYNPNIRPAYFTQHHIDQLDPNQSVLEFFHKKSKLKDDEMRKTMAGFNLLADIQKIGTLSGGQKSRLAFSIMSSSEPNLLILDEPTNHLDMESIDALADCLSNFEGAVISVSHDLRFIEKVFTEVWVCDGGSLKFFSGSIRDYKNMLCSQDS